MKAKLWTAMAAIAMAGTAQAGMAEGRYECWFFSEPRPLLNFDVTGPTRYVGVEGGQQGEYALDGSSLTWVSGPMQGVMPDGFTTVYEVRNGNPTVSFVSGRGSEAAFCELDK